MEQSKQEIQNYQKDEIDIRMLVYTLFEKKFLIAGLTGFITILGFIYSLTFSTSYQATTSVISTSENSIININRLIYVNETKNSVFKSFLSTVLSPELQKKVFLENDFLSQFNKDNNPIDDVDKFIEGVLSSIRVIEPKLNVKEKGLYLSEKPYSISFTGSDEKAVSSYLNALIEQADKENIMKLSKLNKLMISIRLDDISKEIADQLKIEKNSRLNEIETLTEAAKLANSLNIIENNLNIFKDINAVNIAIGNSNNLPEWYLYGEKALLKRINILKNRTNDALYIPMLVELNNEKDKLESTETKIVDATSVNVIINSQIVNISRNKRLTVYLAFIVGFMMSSLLVLTMSVFKPIEKELLLK